MDSNWVRKDEQIRLIMECRQSGLSDYQWHTASGVYPGTFYNWVNKLKKAGYTFPESKSKNNAIPVLQKVVKVNLIEREVAGSEIMEQNTSRLVSENKQSAIAAEILGNITFRLYNGADQSVIQSIMQCMGGRGHAWRYLHRSKHLCRDRLYRYV